MAFRSDLSKLTIPTDIGDEEKFQCNRQKMIEDRLLQCCAKEVALKISNLVLENCEGCHIDQPSWRQHDCLMMEGEEKMWLYFDSALENVWRRQRLLKWPRNSSHRKVSKIATLEGYKITFIRPISILIAANKSAGQIHLLKQINKNSKIPLQ